MNFTRGMNRLGLVVGFLAAALLGGLLLVYSPAPASIPRTRFTAVCLGLWALVWLVMVALGWALDGFRRAKTPP